MFVHYRSQQTEAVPHASTRLAEPFYGLLLRWSNETTRLLQPEWSVVEDICNFENCFFGWGGEGGLHHFCGLQIFHKLRLGNIGVHKTAFVLCKTNITRVLHIALDVTDICHTMIVSIMLHPALTCILWHQMLIMLDYLVMTSKCACVRVCLCEIAINFNISGFNPYTNSHDMIGITFDR